MTSSRTSGSTIFPAPVSPHARYPTAGSTTPYPYTCKIFKLSCTIGFSYMFVFIAGAINFLHLHAITVVVSISSAMPWATFPITLALAGAIITISAFFARDTCSTLYSKLRSNVSTRHLFPVSVSNVIGLIKLTAFFVISTCTSA